MKKKQRIGKVFASLLGCLALTCTSAVTLTGCNVTGDMSASAPAPILHEHVWDEGTVTKEATCTQEGEKTFACTVENCNETKTSVLPKAAHSWDEGETTKEATCTQEGERTYTCTVCHATKKEKLARTAHDWNENDECNICHAVLSYSFSADSLDKGTYTSALSVDGTVYTVYANASKDVSVESKSGSFEGGAKTFQTAVKLNGKANPSGENALSRVVGMTFKKAGNIGVYVGMGGSNKHIALYGEDGALINQHTLGAAAAKYVFLIPEAGTYYIGGDTDTGSIYIFGVDYSEEIIHVHDWDEGTVTRAATCVASGEKTYSCTGCSETKAEVLPKIGHNYVNGVCSVCGVDTLTETDMSELTTGSVVQDLAVGPMFTLVATSEKKSSVDGKSATFGEEEFTKAIQLGGKLNATTAELTSDTCSRGIKVVMPSAGTVTFIAAANSATNFISMRDGAEIENYAFGAKNAVAEYIFTADAAGTYYFGTTTGTAYIYKISAAYGHSVHTWDAGEVTTEATCTHAGVKTYTCTVCGETRTEALDMLSHALQSVAEVPADCTNAGTGAHKECASCHKLFNDNGEEITAESLILPALGHTWDDGVITTPPTYNTDGVKTYTCTACGETRNEAVPMTGEHVWDEGTVTTPATCTTSGVKTYTCTEPGCENVTRTEQIPVDPTAHSLTDVAQTEAACFENGVVAHKECEYCHKVFTLDGEETTVEELSTIPYDKISHRYEQGVCTVCGKAKVLTTDFAGISTTTENVTIDETFAILATADKNVEAKESSAAADGITFVNRIMLGGKGSMPGTNEDAAGYRVLAVTVDGPCTIVVYAKKNKGSYINIGQNAAETAADIAADGNEQALSDTIVRHEFTVTEAGTYYIGTTSSSCYLYYAAVEYPTNTQLHPTCEEKHYDDGVTTEATCTQEGKTVYTCLVCGGTKEISLPVNPAAHKLTTVEAKEANCSEKGYIAHERCEYCGKLFLNGAEVSASDLEIDMVPNHTLTDVAAVTATCTQNGVAAHKECSLCHHYFTLDGEETTLDELSTPVLPHTYEKHVCTVCGAGEVIVTDFAGISTTIENVTIDETFAILATADKNVEAKESSAAADGITFVNRIMLGGKGSMPGTNEDAAGYRVLAVTVDGPCTIVVYAKKNKGSYINIGQNAAETAADIAADGNEQALSDTIVRHEFTVTEAGTYYIGTTSSSCYLYYAAVEYPSAAEAA